MYVRGQLVWLFPADPISDYFFFNISRSDIFWTCGLNFKVATQLPNNANLIAKQNYSKCLTCCCWVGLSRPNCFAMCRMSILWSTALVFRWKHNWILKFDCKSFKLDIGKKNCIYLWNVADPIFCRYCEISARSDMPIQLPVDL